MIFKIINLIFLRIYLFITLLILSLTATASSSDSTVVERYGQIRVQGNKLVDKNNNPVVLRGMSLFWSQWMGKYYNSSCVDWLIKDWKCTVVRAAMGIEMGGYLTNPAVEKAKIKTVIDACIAEGIYVIVDWHDHNAHNHLSQAVTFFQEIAQEYGNTPNIIYEIFNEPEKVSWLNVVKPYADSVVRSIRAIDPDNLIIVGTPTWSQDVDVAALNPLSHNNIAYALHFYAASHKQYLRDKAISALNKGVALFVSEFGTCEYTGTGFLDSVEVETWMRFMEDNKISWCNWSIADKDETASALKLGASGMGNWPASLLTRSGSLIREKIRSGNDSILSAVTLPGELPERYELYQNYPNPFNPTTTITYTVPSAGTSLMKSLQLTIYDILGREIKTLVNEVKPAGSYEVQFNASYLSSGVYFYRLSVSPTATRDLVPTSRDGQAGSFTSVKKLVLMK